FVLLLSDVKAGLPPRPDHVWPAGPGPRRRTSRSPVAEVLAPKVIISRSSTSETLAMMLPSSPPTASGPHHQSSTADAWGSVGAGLSLRAGEPSLRSARQSVK